MSKKFRKRFRFKFDALISIGGSKIKIKIINNWIKYSQILVRKLKSCIKIHGFFVSEICHENWLLTNSLIIVCRWKIKANIITTKMNMITNVLSSREERCYPPVSEASREVANLTERKHLHTSVNGVNNFYIFLHHWQLGLHLLTVFTMFA